MAQKASVPADHPHALFAEWNLTGPTGHRVRVKRVLIPPHVRYYVVQLDGKRVSSFLTLPAAWRRARALSAGAGGFL